MHPTATPRIMGIMNINNESFYKGSRCTTLEAVREKLETMLAHGAGIIDIGACSTRPGSTPVSQEQEWEYLREPLRFIRDEYILHRNQSPDGPGMTISIDTFRSEIVRKAYDLIGPFMVNDISAGEDDSRMLKTVGELNLPYVAMHKRGTPDTMQQLCGYPQGVTQAVTEYFLQFEEKADAAGIREYIVDPGFGFAKTIEQNYELLLGMPRIMEAIGKKCGHRRQLLVGISRKTMLWKPLGITPDEALCATAAINLQALLLGADILRVHDVEQARQCIALRDCLKMAESR